MKVGAWLNIKDSLPRQRKTQLPNRQGAGWAPIENVYVPVKKKSLLAELYPSHVTNSHSLY